MAQSRASQAVGAIVLVLGASAVAGWFGGSGASHVDWSRARGIVIESDDWGLCGFVPSQAALAGLPRRDLTTGHFPPVYWQSTLEDSAAVRRLCDLLARYRGRDGLPVVFQPNYIVGSMGLAADSAGETWIRRRLPDVPPQYARTGLWSAVDAGIAAGVWYPELHGSFHFDPELRRDAAFSNPAATQATRRGILLFPGSGRSWELGPWRPRSLLEEELDWAIDAFTDLFGRKPGSVIAPDYTWDDRCEEIWTSRDLRVVQAKREQRHPLHRTGGLGDRLAKVVSRALQRLRRPEVVYLERNCRLEIVQSPAPEEAMDDCVAAVYSAWERGEPAVIETHRVNFVHLDPEVEELGLRGMDQVLGRVSGADPAPLYLTDFELGQLHRRGTSWCRRGELTVVRNLTRSSKVVWVPAVAGPAGGRLLLLEPNETRILSLSARRLDPATPNHHRNSRPQD